MAGCSREETFSQLSWNKFTPLCSIYLLICGVFIIKFYYINIVEPIMEFFVIFKIFQLSRLLCIAFWWTPICPSIHRVRPPEISGQQVSNPVISRPRKMGEGWGQGFLDCGQRLPFLLFVLFCLTLKINLQSFPSHYAERFRHVLFWEFPCPAWTVARCSSGPLAGGTL